VTDSGEGGNDRIAMGALLSTIVIPVVTLSIACYFIFRDDILGFKALERKEQ
jgi:hypothetical protein